MRSIYPLVTLIALGAAGAWGQALPDRPELVAKPAYLALVKAMRADESFLTTIRQQMENGTHRYNPECLANLRPSLLTPTIAWAIEPLLSEPDAAEATRLFESGSGDKFGVEKILRQQRVVVSVRAEVLDLLNICADTLDRTRQITYCQSPWVRSPDKQCGVRYEVRGLTRETARSTRVSLYCDFPHSALGAVLTELPDRQETIGLIWLAERTVEVVLPPAVTPRYTQTGDRERNLKYEYRTRKSGDPPPDQCTPVAPVDEFGWPASR